MNWKRLLARHGEASNVVARYWYVHGRTTPSGDCWVVSDVLALRKVTAGARVKPYAHRFLSLEDVRTAKNMLRDALGVPPRSKLVKAVLVTVRRVPKGGPKTLPSQRVPQLTQPAAETKVYTNKGRPKLTATFPEGEA